MVRVVAEHEPNLFAIIGIADGEAECPPVIALTDDESGQHQTTYYRARSTGRWVLYRRAVGGASAPALDPGQQ